MKKILNISTIFLAIFLASPILAADLKIGYVDIAKILNESPAAKAAQKKLEQEFTPRNKQLEAKAKKINKQKEKLPVRYKKRIAKSSKVISSILASQNKPS